MLKPGAVVAPAAGAAPVLVFSFTTGTAAVVVPPVPQGGAAGPTSTARQAALLVGGIVLVGCAGVLRRRGTRAG